MNSLLNILLLISCLTMFGRFVFSLPHGLGGWPSDSMLNQPISDAITSNETKSPDTLDADKNILINGQEMKAPMSAPFRMGKNHPKCGICGGKPNQILDEEDEPMPKISNERGGNGRNQNNFIINQKVGGSGGVIRIKNYN